MKDNHIATTDSSYISPEVPSLYNSIGESSLGDLPQPPINRIQCGNQKIGRILNYLWIIIAILLGILFIINQGIDLFYRMNFIVRSPSPPDELKAIHRNMQNEREAIREELGSLEARVAAPSVAAKPGSVVHLHLHYHHHDANNIHQRQSQDQINSNSFDKALEAELEITRRLRRKYEEAVKNNNHEKGSR